MGGCGQRPVQQRRQRRACGWWRPGQWRRQGRADGQRSEQQRRRRVEEKQRRRRVEEQRGGEHRMDKVELGLGGIEIWIGLV